MTYRETHDHLGNPVGTEVPWTWPDLVTCAFLVGVVTALVSGVLA